MNEFEVGDRVTCINNDCFPYFTIGDIYEIEYITNSNNFICLKNNEGGFCHINNIELVERKIGEHWFKPHELHIHENALPLDPEDSVHINSGKYGVYKKVKEFDKNKCGHTNYEGMENMDKKEEFKVDKLGWYESTNTGRRLKLVHFTKEIALFIEYEDSTYVAGYDFKGYYKNNQPIDDLELDKYLGPDLPKETKNEEILDKKEVDAFDYYKDKEKIIRKAKLEILALVNVKLQDLLFQYSDTGVGHKLTFDLGFMIGELHKELGTTEDDE